ncbi:MAG: DUF3540 domain-containing protein [Deltaproteobacteria bacterium]|nr:DUF3540 domain-containing protein [Deltaproteobacteria bacterium]
MENMAHVKPMEALITCGYVKGYVDAFYTVTCRGGTVRAERAAGCLLEPEVDDLVLICRDEEGRGFILSVLKRRKGEGKSSLCLSGDTVLDIKGGALTVSAERVDLRGRRQLSASAPAIEIKAVKGTALLGELSFLAGTLRGSIGKVMTKIGSMETTAERLIQKVKRCYRDVEDFEETRIGRVRYLVKGMFSLRAKNTVIESEEAVRIDGDKIYLG